MSTNDKGLKVNGLKVKLLRTKISKLTTFQDSLSSFKSLKKLEKNIPLSFGRNK